MAAIPTRQEMIEMAKETRTRVTSAPVTPEEFAQFPANVEKLIIPTSVGDSQCYFTTLNESHKAEKTALVINLHGGGFIRERTNCDDLFCRKLIYKTNCKTLDVDYRVAPEHPYPTGLNECYGVVLWAFDNSEKLNINPEEIFLCGHSAGGNFVIGISMLLEKERRPKPAGVIIDYPPLDLVTDPGEKPSKGPGIPAERARLYNLYYCEAHQHGDYLASPIFATDEQLANFPKALFITAEMDNLCTECEDFAVKVARLGTEVTLKRFIGSTHGFTIYKTHGCDEAVKFIVDFINNILT